MSREIPDYLKKNFDPNSLSIPQLRSILKDHGLANVPAPNQPKRVFVKLFNNEILKNRDEILKKLNLTETPKNKRAGRPKKIVENSTENIKSDLPQALRGKSESPQGKDIKNKRVSFGGNDYTIKYESPNKKTTDKIKDDIANKKQEEKVPLIQSTIKRLNEEKELNNLYTKSYDSEQSGISQGRVKRARQQFNNESKQLEIKKIEEEEPSSKKRKQNEKLNANAAVNTSPGNIFQKYDTGKTNQYSTSSRIPKANVVFAEENDDEDDDEDYVYQSNSPSYSSSEDNAINDEEMEDIEHDYATSSNINFSSTIGDNEESNQEQNPPESSSASGTSILQLDNINYSQAMNEGSPLNKISKLEKPKISPSKEPASFLYNNNNSNLFNSFNKLEKERPKTSQSFSYNPNNSLNRSSRVEKPKYSQSFSYNNNYNSFNKSNRLGKPEYSPSNNKKASSYSRKKVPSPYNTSFNDKPKINISYDMSPIQSNHNSLIYDDNSLNHSSSYDRSHTNSNIIGNLYETISEDEESNLMEIASQECSGCSLINVSAGIMSFILTTLIGLFVQWYVSTGGFAGYCEPGKTLVSEYTYLNTLPEDSVLRYNPFYRILPKCLECPKNAICLNNHVVGCKNKDDKLQRKLIASIVPESYLVFPLNEKTCQFDYERKRNYDRLLQNTRSFMYISNNIVRKKLGEIECNEMNKNNFDGFPPKNSNYEMKGISETELKNLLNKEIGGQIREERFNILWVNMMAKLTKYDELKNLCVPERKKKWKTTETKDDTYFCEILKIFRYIPGAGNNVTVINDDIEFSTKEGLLTTTDKPVYSKKCRMKWFMNRYIRSNVYRIIHRYWKYALSMVGLTILAGIVDLLIKKRNKRINVVNSICEEVIWLLQEAEYQNKEDSLHFPSPNISVAQLYDILLPAVIGPKDKNVPEGDCVEIINNDGSTTHYWVFHNPKERALIWKRVYDQVRTNSNVLESNALVKRESHRCWEWIGNPTLYIRRKSPNTKNKQTTYYPKIANNSRLSLGGVSNRSFNTQQQGQQFAGDISAISSSGPNANESYGSLLGNENDNDEVKDASLKGHINKLSIFNDRRQSQIHDDHESEELNEVKEGQQPSFTSTRSSLYPNL